MAAPVVKDGRIYTIDSAQKVTAFDATNGRRVWDKQLKAANPHWDEFSVGGGLAITGDKLIVASGFGYVRRSSFPTVRNSGAARSNRPLSSSPAIMGNRAFLTSTNNDFYAIDTDTGEILWNDQALAETARVLSSPSPAVTQDILAVGYSSGELIAYLPANGRRLWTDTLTSTGRYTPLSAINDIAGKPTIQDGVVYAASHSGVLTAIDARSGARDLEPHVRLAPRTGDRRGLPVRRRHGRRGRLFQQDRRETRLETRTAGVQGRQPREPHRLDGAADRLSGKLVIVSSEGDVLALSAQNGDTVSELKLGQSIFIEPIAAAGKIFILTDQANLVAIK